jgi:hypothetical protein
MKLYATTTSEKGKPATKGAQEWLEIELEAGREKTYRIRYSVQGDQVMLEVSGAYDNDYLLRLID